MATLTKVTFTNDDKEYEVVIDFKDQQIMEDLIVFEVAAKVSDEDGRSHTEALSIEMNWNEGTTRILKGDQELHVFRFDDLGVRIDGISDKESIPGIEEGELQDKVFDAVDKEIGEAIAEAINAMPSPDPILGCALKAGISSILGQAITCNEVRRNYPQEGSRFSQIVRCLRKHAQGIASRTLWRAARCMIRLGF